MAFKKYFPNESCFDEINEHSAYWIGFLMADGYVIYDRYLYIKLMSSDSEHLLKFNSFAENKRPLIYNKNSVQTYINSKTVCDKVKKYGIIPRKSLVAKCMNPNLLYNRHFWRGVIDGDGCIAKYKYPVLSLVGSSFLLEQYKNYIISIIPNFKGNLCKMGNVFIIQLGCKRAYTIIKELYTNCSIYLDRKYKKAKEIINFYPSIIEC